MNLRNQFERALPYLMLGALGSPLSVWAQASAPDSGKGDVVCPYRAPPWWDAPTPMMFAFFGLLAFFALCALGLLAQSARRNRLLEEQVAGLMRGAPRELSGTNVRS